MKQSKAARNTKENKYSWNFSVHSGNKDKSAGR